MASIDVPTSARLFLIHVLTASGAAFALLALLAADDGRWVAMFAWFGLALIVDAIDGPLARHFDVKRELPRWSGETLDLVIDFATYVFVPAYAIVVSNVLPDGFAPIFGVAIVVTGALYFADRDMKTADDYFRGFPALWNLAAFYLLLIGPSPWLAATAVVVLCVMTFMRFPFVHPLRVARNRPFNVAIVALWAVLAIIALAHNLSPGPLITVILCAIGVYFLSAGVFRRAP